MTRGQETLTIDMAPPPSLALDPSGAAVDLSAARRTVGTIAPSDEELAAHREYLRAARPGIGGALPLARARGRRRARDRATPSRGLIDGRGLPAEDPHREGLRRRDRVGARARAGVVAPARQPRSPEARGPAERLLLQAARRVQQDGAPHGRGARARRDRGVRGQPRAGRRARRADARLRGDDRRARDHAAHQDRRGRGARRQGRAARRLVQRRLRARARAAEALARRVRASLRRSGRHRRPGNDRHGDPAPVPGADRRDLRRHRRRRARRAGSPRT